MDASALAQLLNPDVDPAPHLRDVAASLVNQSEQERQLAVVVLGRIGEPAAEYLIRALDPAQPDIVRTTAATVLAGLAPPVVSAVRSLCRCLTSPEENLRTVASLALGKIGASAVPSLCLLLKFSDPDVVAAAIGALSMIGPARRRKSPRSRSAFHWSPATELCRRDGPCQRRCCARPACTAARFRTLRSRNSHTGAAMHHGAWRCGPSGYSWNTDPFRRSGSHCESGGRIDLGAHQRSREPGATPADRKPRGSGRGGSPECRDRSIGLWKGGRRCSASFAQQSSR